jgi:hypothetical protein
MGMRFAFRAAILVATLGILATAVGTGCGVREDSPDPAFDRLRVAIVGRDARLLYGALDTESRWAVDTVWKYQKDTAALVQKFPPAARDRVLERVGDASEAGTAPEFLARQTMVANPLGRLPDEAGLGSIGQVERRPDGTALVITSTGLRLPFGPGSDGRWGWLGLRDELVRWRDASANDYKRLAEEAKLYP